MSEGYQSIHTGADIDAGISLTQTATHAVTASALVQRDSNARFQAADPSSAQDVVTKNYGESAYDPAGTGAAEAGTVAADLATHEGDTSNPHSVTKTQVGLGSVDNTSDADKPVSTAQQAALDLKADDPTAVVPVNYDAESDGTLAAHLAGIDTELGVNASSIAGHIANISNPHSVTKAQVGLGSADNTADLDKPISTAVQAALDSLAPSYAEIHVHSGSAAQSIPNGASYTKLTLWLHNGHYDNCTPNALSGKITITRPGRYLVTGCFSFSLDTNLVNVIASAFLAGVEQDHIHFQRKVGTGSDVGAAGFNGIVDAYDTGDMDLDVRVRHDYGSAVGLTLIYANLTVNYLGE